MRDRVARPHAAAHRRARRRRPLHRDRAAVGVPAPRPEVRRRDGPRRVRRRRSARWCSTAGSRCSTALELDPMPLDGQLDWVTKLALLDAYVDRDGLEWDDPKLRCSTSSTTTSGPSGRSTSGSCGPARSSVWSTRTRSTRRSTEPPATHPGLLPGPVPRALARLGRRRQLGQHHPRRRIATRCGGSR